ncbi:hypothetical protein B0F90DRAFT_1736174 [Multifurca ochricompacta]|uniref:Secreted protein n=1 Tax=Multifurca ochricompacta TaxID=376703 RepID=A0AAD4M375_9AGAM|nr:hypothetical protein B0F90DRAFT_1786185 [Multifurca ochricompacta]KAI0298065.1 hypothetical protein B0F90DRAFT_1736174 [Multifurca ochricompacta]
MPSGASSLRDFLSWVWSLVFWRCWCYGGLSVGKSGSYLCVSECPHPRSFHVYKAPLMHTLLFWLPLLDHQCG